MANRETAYGLRPYGLVGGRSNNMALTQYIIDNASDDETIYNTAIFQGSPVIPTNDGTIELVGSASGGSVALLGVFAGCEYVSSSTGKPVFRNYYPGSSDVDSNHDVKAFVYDDPNMLFTIMTSNAQTTEDTEGELKNATVFANADFANATSGSTTTGISSATLDLNTLAATAALNMRVVGVLDQPGNDDFTAAGIPLIVRLNNHFNNASGDGTAIGTGLFADA
jgi:hypothetical protein